MYFSPWLYIFPSKEEPSSCSNHIPPVLQCTVLPRQICLMNWFQSSDLSNDLCLTVICTKIYVSVYTYLYVLTQRTVLNHTIIKMMAMKCLKDVYI